MKLSQEWRCLYHTRKISSWFCSFIQMSLFTPLCEPLSWFSLEENLPEKMVVHQNCLFFQFDCQTVDFYQKSVLRYSQGSVDLLSCTMTAKTTPKFSGSSAELFHRKSRAETLSTLPIPHPTVSPQRVEEFKVILPSLHPQDTDLSALKRGTGEGIMTGKYKK